MQTFLDQLSAFATSHFVAAISGVAALIGTSLLTYFREQVRAIVRWALDRLNRLLPWDQQVDRQDASAVHTALVADFSLVEVVIEEPSGAIASYKKLSRYREGVSADGSATDFSTMRGKIVHTQSEHGFFVSQIDLGTVVHRGAHVTNLYEAKLLNCFTTGDESWTQEIAFPTKQLTMLIHFPVARPRQPPK
jgi:hypothetical protein